MENVENLIGSMKHELSLLKQSVSQLQRDLGRQQCRFLVFLGIVLSFMIFGFFTFRDAIRSLRDQAVTSAVLLPDRLGKALTALSDELTTSVKSLRNDVGKDLTALSGELNRTNRELALLLRQQSARPRTREKTFPIVELNGIIRHLSRRCCGNIHNRNIVTATASGSLGTEGDYHARNAADLTADSVFISRDEPNSWFCYDFRRMRIRPTAYSIRSHYRGQSGWSYPMNWVAEGSTDGIDWVELDRQENYCLFENRNVIRTFSVSSSPEIRMIRIRNIGKSRRGNNLLELSGLEIFGTLIEKDEAEDDAAWT
jgi:hypothetical protein